MDDESRHEALIAEFCSLTAASPEDARRYLSANRWDFASAASEFYTSQEEGSGEGAEAEVPENYTGPRTLDGRPAPSAASAGPSRPAAPPTRRGIQTLGSLGGGGATHAHDDDDDDDEDYDPRDEPRDLFAGGEKSGLAVQDPRRSDPRQVVNDILQRARQNAQRPGGEPSEPTPQRFRGSGRTLGGDDAPSQFIPAEEDPNPGTGALQTRTLHLWEDGFSVEDGPLHRFDDPQNAADLNMIRQGRAPLHLMGVRPGQPVDVQLNKHDEKYKAPPKKYKPFSGAGQRLGSPTPGPTPSVPSSSTTAPAASSSSSNNTPSISVDPSQPTVNLRIQLVNGQRVPARFNTTHTIGDVYNFIAQASPDASGRSWVLATTFPNKDHTDKSLALSDVPEFAKGGTAVQKWA